MKANNSTFSKTLKVIAKAYLWLCVAELSMVAGLIVTGWIVLAAKCGVATANESIRRLMRSYFGYLKACHVYGKNFWTGTPESRKSDIRKVSENIRNFYVEVAEIYKAVA